MRIVQEASIPTIHPFTHLFTHRIFPLVHHLAPHPSLSTLPKKEVRIDNSLIFPWYNYNFQDFLIEREIKEIVSIWSNAAVLQL